MTASSRRRCLVTGVAGFIGSHLAEHLLASGHSVIGVDAFTDYYARELKVRNLQHLIGQPAFTFRDENLLTADLGQALDGIELVFHLAAQPGVRKSWGGTFETYLNQNVLATQRLLEVARGTAIKRFVFASSSSVYGRAAELPARETTLPQPVSPYGVTKLAAEHLCGVYAQTFGLPAVSLRYFTVYGPRQRPDMAFTRFIRAILEGEAIEVYGDGEQTRDFTYVSDAVAATVAAATADVGPPFGRVYNIGGGSRVSVNTVIGLLERMTGKTARVVKRPAQPGDARDTFADCSAARAALDYGPAVDLEAGLDGMIRWQAANLVVRAR
jgi:nucleoside-diphosphate-sugar epimerase